MPPNEQIKGPIRWTVKIEGILILEGYSDDEVDSEISKHLQKICLPGSVWGTHLSRTDGKQVNPE